MTDQTKDSFHNIKDTHLDFAYVSFITNNQPYIDLIKITIESVRLFSKYKFIVYCIDIPEGTIQPSDHLILRYINNIKLPSVYYFKPFIILNAIEQGLESGYYIEADDVITPQCDSLFEKSKKLTDICISPIHPDEPYISQNYMSHIGVEHKTQHYIHAHVLFRNTNYQFIKEWFANCLKSTGFCWDETALNCTYWKYKCVNHFLDIIDPWYESFYVDENTSTACTFHGCKNPIIQQKLLHDMINQYKTAHK